MQIKEIPVTFGANNTIIGILTIPRSGDVINLPAIIIPNTGVLHHVGPNRLHVRIARHLAGNGFPVLRFDLSGLGDSVNTETTLDFTTQADIDLQAGMEYLERKFGVSKFILLGMCSGVHYVLYRANHDSRICSLILIDGFYIPYEGYADVYAKAYQRYYMRMLRYHIFNVDSWKKLTRRADIAGRVKKGLISIFQKPVITDHQVNRFPVLFEPLIGRGIHVYLLFAGGFRAIDVYNLSYCAEVSKALSTRLIHVDVINDADHLFSLNAHRDHLVNILSGKVKLIQRELENCSISS